MASGQAQTKPTLTGKWTGTLTRTAPDGRSQSLDCMFDLTQKGKVDDVDQQEGDRRALRDVAVQVGVPGRGSRHD
jgi:hypothetical protein